MEKSSEAVCKINLNDLAPKVRLQVLNDLPLYVLKADIRPRTSCIRAAVYLKKFENDTRDRDILSKEFPTLTILLTDETFAKDNLYHPQLNQELSILFNKYPGLMLVDLYLLIDKKFKLEYVISKEAVSTLRSLIQECNDQLDDSKGPVPYVSIDNTVKALEDYAAELAKRQSNPISFTRSDFLKWFNQGDTITLDYVPFFESLYELGSTRFTPTAVLGEKVFIEVHKEKLPKTSYNFSFKASTGTLTFGDNGVVTFPIDKKQIDLLKVLLDRELGDKIYDIRTYNEFKEDNLLKGDPDKLRKRADAIAAKILKHTGIENFMLVTSTCIKINDQYRIVWDPIES